MSFFSQRDKIGGLYQQAFVKSWLKYKTAHRKLPFIQDNEGLNILLNLIAAAEFFIAFKANIDTKQSEKAFSVLLSSLREESIYARNTGAQSLDGLSPILDKLQMDDLLTALFSLLDDKHQSY